jgi:hypothetical protein
MCGIRLGRLLQSDAFPEYFWFGNCGQEKDFRGLYQNLMMVLMASVHIMALMLMQVLLRLLDKRGFAAGRAEVIRFPLILVGGSC